MPDFRSKENRDMVGTPPEVRLWREQQYTTLMSPQPPAMTSEHKLSKQPSVSLVGTKPAAPLARSKAVGGVSWFGGGSGKRRGSWLFTWRWWNFLKGWSALACLGAVVLLGGHEGPISLQECWERQLLCQRRHQQ